MDTNYSSVVLVSIPFIGFIFRKKLLNNINTKYFLKIINDTSIISQKTNLTEKDLINYYNYYQV